MAQSKKTVIGKVPVGDIRLSANIREDLHLRLKIMAVKSKKPIGDILEEWIEQYTPLV